MSEQASEVPPASPSPAAAETATALDPVEPLHGAVGAGEMPRRIAVVGEIPFAGRALVRALVRRSLPVRVLCPDEQADQATRSAGEVQVVPETWPKGTLAVEVARGDLDSPTALAAVLEGAYGACLLSPITMDGRVYRAQQHLEDVRRFVQAAQNAGVQKLVYHSALGAHVKALSLTLRAAAAAEEVIRPAQCRSYLVRTGPLVGPGDGFLSNIVDAVRRPSPSVIVWGYGSTTVQPLHVDDMGRCMARLLVDKPEELQPGRYSLAGPETVTLLELLDRAAARLGRSKLRFHIPLFVLRLAVLVNPSQGFRERVDLLFDGFCAEHNDAPRLLGPGDELVPLKQTLDALLAAPSTV
ncbi:MAG: NmrA family NAD(P)-binding protein [Planctomycetota bacterium]|nr:NmrA family NAD(P)-binding protein [Planctomycetota bacterium]